MRARLNEPAKLAAEFSPGRAERNEVKRSAALGTRQKVIREPALAGDRFFRPLKRAEQEMGRLPRVPLAMLASPWTKFCRQLRWLVELFLPSIKIISGLCLQNLRSKRRWHNRVIKNSVHCALGFGHRRAFRPVWVFIDLAHDIGRDLFELFFSRHFLIE